MSKLCIINYFHQHNSLSLFVKIVKFLKVYLNKLWTWMSTVCIFSLCIARSTSIFLFQSCLTSINPTLEFLELLFQMFALFYQYPLDKTLKLFVTKSVKSVTFAWKKTLNLWLKMNTNIQCFSDGNRNMFAKTAERTFEFYLKRLLTWKEVFHPPVFPEQFLNFTIKTENINEF